MFLEPKMEISMESNKSQSVFKEVLKKLIAYFSQAAIHFPSGYL